MGLLDPPGINVGIGDIRYESRRVIDVRGYIRADGVMFPTGAVMLAGSTTLTVALASFTVADIGKMVRVDGAAASSNPLKTTIAAVTSTTTATLAVAAAVAVNGTPVYYGTDATTAIQAAMNDAYALANLAVEPVVLFEAGIYLTTVGIVHRSGVHARGAGRDRTRVINMSGGPSVSRATCWHLGTYGPAVSPASLKGETGYPINDAVAGTNALTLASPGDAASFTVGDIVGIEGGELRANSPNTPNEITRIERIVGAVLTIDRPLEVDYVADTAAPVLRRLNTGTVASSVADRPEFSGDTAHLTVGASIRGMALVSLVSGYASINLSAFECQITDVRLEGWENLTGNPVSRCHFSRINGVYTHGACEWAYHSHHTRCADSTFTRVGDSNASSGRGIWINNDEGARACAFERVVLNDAGSTASDYYSLYLYQGSAWVGGSITSERTAAGDAGAVWCSASSLSAATVNSTGGCGVRLANVGSVLARTKIRGTPPGSHAVEIVSGATSAAVTDNVLGQGTRTPATRWPRCWPQRADPTQLYACTPPWHAGYTQRRRRSPSERRRRFVRSVETSQGSPGDSDHAA